MQISQVEKEENSEKQREREIAESQGDPWWFHVVSEWYDGSVWLPK